MIDIRDHGVPFGGGGLKGVIQYTVNGIANAVTHKDQQYSDRHYNNDGGYTLYTRHATNYATLEKKVYNSAGTLVSTTSTTTDANILRIYVSTHNEIIVNDSAGAKYVLDSNLTRVQKKTSVGSLANLWASAKMKDSSGNDYWVGFVDGYYPAVYNDAGTQLVMSATSTSANWEYQVSSKINNKLVILENGASNYDSTALFYLEGTTAKMQANLYNARLVQLFKSFGRRI